MYPCYSAEHFLKYFKLYHCILWNSNPKRKVCLPHPIWDALRDFGTTCTILKTWKTPLKKCYVYAKAKPATLLKVTLLHGCFSRFWNYTNGTKLRNPSHIKYENFTFKTWCHDLLMQTRVTWDKTSRKKLPFPGQKCNHQYSYIQCIMSTIVHW